MPRQFLNISSFDKGVVLAADNEDIPENAASHSENVWANTDDGKLIGRPGDTELQATKPVYGLRSYGFINRDGQKFDLVYLDTSNTKLAALIDFYGASPTSKDIALGTLSTYASIVANNKEVHVGLGGSESTPPVWVGYVTKGQFGASVPIDPIVESAECVVPGTIPFFHKIHTDGTYVWGIEYDGRYLYRVTIATGAIAKTPAGTFSRTRAMCPDKTAGYVWVYDQDGAYGKMYRIDAVNLTVDRSHSINTFTVPSGYNVTDIAVTTLATNGTLWIAFTGDNFAHTTGLLWRWTIATFGAITLTDVTPDLIASTSNWDDNLGEGTAGKLAIRATGGGYSDSYTAITPRFPICLFPLAADRVGWMVYVKDHSSISINGGMDLVEGPYYVKTGDVLENVSHVVISIPDSATANSAFPLIGVNATEPAQNYLGVYYDSGAGKLYTSIAKNLYQHTVSTVPTTNGQFISAPSTATKTLTYNGAVTAQSTEVYLARRAGVVGIDKVNTTMTTETEVYGGGNVFVDSATNDTGTSGFTARRRYFYRLALEYDGFQISPLSPGVEVCDNDTNETYGKDVVVKVKDISNISKRVTAIYLFRASGEFQGSVPDALYRKVERISVTDGRWVLSTAGSVTTATISINDDIEHVGETFEALSGLPESAETSIVHYGLSAQTNSMLFVAKCWHRYLPDASSMIFRSKSLRFDTFDPSVDFLKLPTVPTALHAFRGRLYAFDENHIYRINPAGLFIEDIYEGVGAFNQNSVCVTEEAMFIADRNNVYLHDGTRPFPIGNAILNRTDSISGISDRSYKAMVSNLLAGTNPVLLYDSVDGYLLVAFKETTTGADFAWGFHLAKKRWDFFAFTGGSFGNNSANIGWAVGPRGEVYFSSPNKFVRIFDPGATRTTFTWISQRFTGTSDTLLRKFYKIKKQGSGTTVTYSVDEGAFTALTAESVAEADRMKRTIRVKVVSSLATDYLNGLTIIFREMIGAR